MNKRALIAVNVVIMVYEKFKLMEEGSLEESVKE